MSLQPRDPETGRFVATSGPSDNERYILAWVAVSATMGGLIGAFAGIMIAGPALHWLRFHGWN